MNFTAEELQKNYNRLLGLIETYIQGDRKKDITQLYVDHAERIMIMPASSTDHHHNAFPGGYVDHVIRVVECALKLKELWTSMGAIVDYTDEELVFAAMNHDLGKIGTEEAEQYVFNESEWHRKNQGRIYRFNLENPFMTVPDRSLFLLQQRGIPISLNEYLAIKIHDGLYEESNRSYFISNHRESKLRSNLPIILHHADHMAARIEFEMWDQKNPLKKETKKVNKNKNSIDESDPEISQSQREDLINVFNSLF